MVVVWIVAIPAPLELVVEEAGKVVLPVIGGQVRILSQICLEPKLLSSFWVL